MNVDFLKVISYDLLYLAIIEMSQESGREGKQITKSAYALLEEIKKKRELAAEEIPKEVHN